MTGKGKKSVKESKNGSHRKLIIIFVSVFVSIAIVLGASLGIAGAIKRSKSAVIFRGVTMSREVASFFTSQYKYNFMGALRASGVVGVADSPGFWNKDSGSGKTYGELLDNGAREYVAQIMVTNYLYDRNARLSSADKKSISMAVSEALTYKADGSVKTFNEAVMQYGFSYDSFKDAATMLYKATRAQNIICGEGGEVFKSSDSEVTRQAVSDYLLEYTHVKLLFIRTEKTFVLDDKGNRVTEGGSYLLRDLTEEERDERQQLISEIRGYIGAVGTGEASMGPDMFDNYLSENDEGDRDSHDYGYYFHKKAEFSEAFAEEFQDVINTAYDLPTGKFGEAEVDFGVCFIYKYQTNESDLKVSALEACFSDFYTDLSDSFFANQISLLTPSVDFRERFGKIDVRLLPYNYIYVPVFQ